MDVDDAVKVVLCINCGSSSLKFAVFGADTGAPRPLAKGAAVDIATLLRETRRPPPTLVAHRLVHGGARYVKPTRIDREVLAALKELVPLAPLHMPPAIAGIEAVAESYPDVPQVACFDTAFHASLPERSRRMPLPDAFDREGVRRYGFHGLSYEYVMSTLGPTPPSRIVIAHLGNGASLAAVKDGKAFDTTMGLTPAGGVLMGTRTGDLDPGALVYLLRHHGLSPDALEHVVDRESGLLAIGGTSDMRTLLGRSDARARLAVDMFTYGVRKAIGSLGAALGGIDQLVFTGGIGEHAAEVRERACAGLEFMGIRIDVERNRGGAGVISEARSPCVVSVVATDEDLVMARHALALT